MALGVVLLDMLKLRGIFESGNVPVQVSQPPMDRWVSRSNVADIGLEVLDVDRVEADNGCEESDICFGDGVAEEEC